MPIWSFWGREIIWHRFWEDTLVLFETSGSSPSSVPQVLKLKVWPPKGQVWCIFVCLCWDRFFLCRITWPEKQIHKYTCNRCTHIHTRTHMQMDLVGEIYSKNLTNINSTNNYSQHWDTVSYIRNTKILYSQRRHFVSPSTLLWLFLVQIKDSLSIQNSQSFTRKKSCMGNDRT